MLDVKVWPEMACSSRASDPKLTTRFWVFTLFFSCGSVLGQFSATATLSSDGSWLGCDWWHFKLSSSCLGEQLLRRGGSSLFLLPRCRASSFSCFSSIHVVAPSPPTPLTPYTCTTCELFITLLGPSFLLVPYFWPKIFTKPLATFLSNPHPSGSFLTKSPWARCAVGV